MGDILKIYAHVTYTVTNISKVHMKSKIFYMSSFTKLTQKNHLLCMAPCNSLCLLKALQGWKNKSVKYVGK